MTMNETLSADASIAPAPKRTLGVTLKGIFLKPVLKLLEKVLPAKAFDRFYASTFPVYKEVARAGYLLGNILTLKFLNSEEWARVKRVHAVMPYSLVGAGGLDATDRAAQSVNLAGVQGDFAELGVARGGCASLLGMSAFAVGAPNRKLWLFDSYEGLPEPGERDFVAAGDTGDHVRPLPKGSCFGALEEVRWLTLEKFKLPEDRIEFVQGWFENTVPANRGQIEKLAILRIDGDWYESTKVCLEGLFGKVQTGGVVIIDDYDSCIGAKRAVDEFVAANRLNVTLCSDGRGGRWFRKS
ncbi:TylF/MycF/NovP-related O-methyltransferase [uncultured Brevundimonas sp.]|mgnify:CR=1 FL=1|uniref:TylF/MycF/NovP-related O-methyltransferase n=1 Tax=uncultured Brevundimonas sp. TaxID=213418 RepID=UPI0030EBAF2F|tara:strand:+ start:1326 stop:2219 length:894 start_codon:yes stop_codon:yes gene_type:complete